MKLFEGKVVAITGVSSGIGRCAVKMFAQEGAKVVGIARRENLLKELEAEVAATGGIFVPIAGDITSEENVNHLIDYTVETFGRIDVLVNNAGAMDYATPVADMERAVWDRCITMNLTVPMMTMRRALFYMLKQENGGNIVNVGSTASLRGAINGAAYTASKHGLVGLTKNTAYTYAKRKIRCNMVCPSGVDTVMCAPETQNQSTLKNPETYPLYKEVCRTMTKCAPEEIAKIILYLASDVPQVLNGAIITADSGYTAS